MSNNKELLINKFTEMYYILMISSKNNSEKNDIMQDDLFKKSLLQPSNFMVDSLIFFVIQCRLRCTYQLDLKNKMDKNRR